MLVHQLHDTGRKVGPYRAPARRGRAVPDDSARRRCEGGQSKHEREDAGGERGNGAGASLRGGEGLQPTTFEGDDERGRLARFADACSVCLDAGV